MNLVLKVLEKLSNILFPASPVLKALLARVSKEGISFLPRQTQNNSEVTSPFSYANPDVRLLIHEMKYRRNKTIAQHFAETLHDEIISELQEHYMDIHTKPIVTFIPSTSTTKFRRGYQHIDTLRLTIEKTTGCNLFQHIFPLLEYKNKRNRQTEMKNRSKRLENMNNAFATNRNLDGEIIFLIDDVTTTGATLQDGKRALIEAGARKVHLFALAH